MKVNREYEKEARRQIAGRPLLPLYAWFQSSNGLDYFNDLNHPNHLNPFFAPGGVPANCAGCQLHLNSAIGSRQFVGVILLGPDANWVTGVLLRSNYAKCHHGVDRPSTKLATVVQRPESSASLAQ